MRRLHVSRKSLAFVTVPVALAMASVVFATPIQSLGIRGGVLTTETAGRCQFCVKNEANGKEACDTIVGGCASGTVCSGRGGIFPSGNPWAEAVCVPAPSEYAPPIHL